MTLSGSEDRKGLTVTLIEHPKKARSTPRGTMDINSPKETGGQNQGSLIWSTEG